MSELDKILLDLFKKNSSDLSVKDRIPLDEDLGIRKVAFDMYKVYGDHYDGLWKVEEDGDKKFLVRASDPRFGTQELDKWTASSNYEHTDVTLKYRGVPICSFSADQYGFKGEDIFTFKSALLDIVKEDQGFIKKVIASQPKLKAEAISNMFPELIK
jgi:hypothetical protein